MSKFRKVLDEIEKSHREMQAKMATDEEKIKVWLDSLDKPELFKTEPMPPELYEAFQRFGIIRQNRICKYGMKAYRKLVKLNRYHKWYHFPRQTRFFTVKTTISSFHPDIIDHYKIRSEECTVCNRFQLHVKDYKNKEFYTTSWLTQKEMVELLEDKYHRAYAML